MTLDEFFEELRKTRKDGLFLRGSADTETLKEVFPFDKEGRIVCRKEKAW